MAKNKKSEDTTLPLPNTVYQESNEVITMEYIIKRYIANLFIIGENDVIGSVAPIKDYIAEITRFVSSYNLARGFHTLLTEAAATNLWKTIRTEYRDISLFLLHVTSEYRMVYGPEEFREVCRKMAHAITFNYDSDSSIITKSDPIFAKALPPESKMEDKIEFLMGNPWLVTMYFISIMNPIRGE